MPPQQKSTLTHAIAHHNRTHTHNPETQLGQQQLPGVPIPSATKKNNAAPSIQKPNSPNSNPKPKTDITKTKTKSKERSDDSKLKPKNPKTKTESEEPSDDSKPKNDKTKPESKERSSDSKDIYPTLPYHPGIIGRIPSADWLSSSQSTDRIRPPSSGPLIRRQPKPGAPPSPDYPPWTAEPELSGPMKGIAIPSGGGKAKAKAKAQVELAKRNVSGGPRGEFVGSTTTADKVGKKKGEDRGEVEAAMDGRATTKDRLRADWARMDREHRLQAAGGGKSDSESGDEWVQMGGSELTEAG